jgi:outer membrane protein OmpA-like peptidoglycan-associated protein
MGENSELTEKPALPRRGKFEVKPLHYLKLHERGEKRSNKQRANRDAKGCQIVYIAAENRRLADPRPDPQSPRITGRYQDKAGTFTFLINQAGKHIECFLAEVLTANDSRRKRFWEISGDLEKDGKFALYDYPDTQKKSGFIFVKGNSLEMQLTNSKVANSSTLVRLEKRSTLSPNAIAALPKPRTLFAAYELTPFTIKYMDWLKEALDSNVINKYLERFLSKASIDRQPERLERIETAQELDRWFGQHVFPTKGALGWHEEDLELARFHVRRMLAKSYVTINDAPRSHIDWIQTLLNRYNVDKSRYKIDRKLSNIRENLDLAADTDEDASTKPHEYDVTLMVGGLAADVVIGVSGFTGILQIHKKTPPTWKQEYIVALFGASVGASISVSVGFKQTGTARTYNSWGPVEIPGWLHFYQGGVRSRLGIGASKGTALMDINGNGTHSRMQVDFSGWAWDASIGAGAEVGGMWGYAFESGVRHNDDHYRRIIKEDDYTIEANLAKQVHFRLGDALLTEQGRHALRVMAAKELAAFNSETSMLVIDGHSDRVDCDDRNLELSDLRAKNTLQALKDILADQLKIPDKRIITRGHGERMAKKIDRDEDEVPNKKWRRVDVLLNARLVLRLTGQ